MQTGRERQALLCLYVFTELPDLTIEPTTGTLLRLRLRVSHF